MRMARLYRRLRRDSHARMIISQNGQKSPKKAFPHRGVLRHTPYVVIGHWSKKEKKDEKQKEKRSVLKPQKRGLQAQLSNTQAPKRRQRKQNWYFVHGAETQRCEAAFVSQQRYHAASDERGA